MFFYFKILENEPVNEFDRSTVPAASGVIDPSHPSNRPRRSSGGCCS